MFYVTSGENTNYNINGNFEFKYVFYHIRQCT